MTSSPVADLESKGIVSSSNRDWVAPVSLNTVMGTGCETSPQNDTDPSDENGLTSSLTSTDLLKD